MRMPAPPQLVPDTSRRDWTAEELALLADDGNWYEFVDGELLVTPPPTWTHQGATGELLFLLHPYAREHGMHCLTARADVPFSRNTVVEPNLFVVPLRTDGSRPRDFSEVGRLLLAVEVLSSSTARADRHVKRSAYQKHGVPDSWIVDAADRFVERWRPGDASPEILAESLTWQPRGDVPPLVIHLVELFRRIHGDAGA